MLRAFHSLSSRYVAAVVIVVAAGSVAGTASAASNVAALGRCGSAAGTLIYHSGNVALFKNANFIAKVEYVACWTPTGKRDILVTFPVSATSSSNPEYDFGGIKVSGSWVVWLVLVGPPLGGLSETTATVRSIDVPSGRLGPVVSVMSALNTPTDGPAPANAIGEGDTLSDVVITSNGWYAWLSVAAAVPRGSETEALYVPDGKSGDVRIASSALHISKHPDSTRGITDLRAHGTTVTWRRNGTPHMLNLVDGVPVTDITGGTGGSGVTGGSGNTDA